MEYHDRSTGLIVFGVLTVGLGLLCGLFVVLMMGSVLLVGSLPPNGSLKPTPAMLAPAVLVYGTLAVALIWLGIGSMLAKRWARALMLVFSWSWLVVGVFVITMMAVILPSTLNNLPARPGSLAAPSTPLVMDGVLAFMFVFYGFIFVLLPAIWTFFFNSRHVKATFRCPIGPMRVRCRFSVSCFGWPTAS